MQSLQDPYGYGMPQQFVGPRALAQRREGPGQGSIAYDPSAFFRKYLAQAGLNLDPGAALLRNNPQTVQQYEQAAQRLDRFAAIGRGALANYQNMRPAVQPMFYNAAANVRGSVNRLELGAAQERLGAQVFAGGAGEWTNALRGYQKAIQQQQSLGGTYDTLLGASQEAAGTTSFTNQSRAALAAPLDASTMLSNDYISKIFGGSLGELSNVNNIYGAASVLNKNQLNQQIATKLGAVGRV